VDENDPIVLVIIVIIEKDFCFFFPENVKKKIINTKYIAMIYFAKPSGEIDFSVVNILLLSFIFMRRFA
jgi:hypothetical protein